MKKIEWQDYMLKDYNLIKTSLSFKTYQKKDKKYYFKECINDKEAYEKKLYKIGKEVENIKGNLVPIDTMYYKNNQFYGYEVPNIKGIDYKELFFNNINLDLCTDIFSDLYFTVKKYEKNAGLVFSDLCTNGNILYDKDKKKNTIIDLDGITVIPYSSSVISSKIDNSVYSSSELRRLHLVRDQYGKVDKGIIYTDLFYDNKNKYFKKRINDLSLYTLYYSSITGLNFMLEEINDKEHFKERVSNQLQIMGLSDRDLFYRNTLDILDPKSSYKDSFLASIMDLSSRYTLKERPSITKGKTLRKFIEK